MARKRSLLGSVLGLLLKAVAVSLMVATPLLGVWIASSLAALQRGPVWLTLVAGLLLCPILPVAWELWSHARRSKGEGLLSLSDRLILRTLLLNVVFLVALLATKPTLAFTALSARGDWMLDGRADARSVRARGMLFGAAAKLEWMYLLAHDNPFKRYVQDQQPSPSPQPSPPVPTVAPQPVPAPVGSEVRKSTDIPAENPSPVPTWPVAATLSPVVTALPPEAETSPDSVAAYLQAHTTDPVERLKAVHDYVADRVAYDVPALSMNRMPPQDAGTVFRSHLGVCAGYANLVEAIGRAAGLEVKVVVGDARGPDGDIAGGGHAWNAAKLHGAWFLIDATWDSGSVSAAGFEKGYGTDYFLTPPRVFGVDHLPEDSAWQLLDKPLSRGEFVRQPGLRPAFFASGLVLVSPERSQVDVRGGLEILLGNPQDVFLMASYTPRAGGQGRQQCAVLNGPNPRINCNFNQPGAYEVHLFTNRERLGTYHGVGQLQVNAL